MTERSALKLVFFLAILLTGNNNGFAQKKGQEKSDSLKNILKNYKSPCKVPCISDSIRINLLNEIAWEYKFKIPDSAFYYGKEAIKQSEEIKWFAGRAQSYHQVASFYYNKADYMSSVEMYNKALKIWNELEKKPIYIKSEEVLFRKAKTLGNLGSVYQAINDYSNALDSYFKALDIDEKLGNKDGMATKLGNLGNFFYKENQYSKALEYYAKQMKIDEEVQNKKRMGAFLGNVGLAYLGLRDTAKALEYEFKSLDINNEAGNKKYLARDYQNIAMIYDHLRKNFMAIDYFNKALKLNLELQDKSGTAIVLGNIGSFYLDRGNFKEAEKHLLQSVAISDSIGELIAQRDNRQNLVMLYEKTGKHIKALAQFKKTVELKDSLFNENKTKEITRKEMNYEFDKKQASVKAEQEKKEIAHKAEVQKQKLIRNCIAGGSGIFVLSGIFSFFFYKRKRDAEQKQKEISLSLMVSETEMKALRSQMNPHFIFNALQSIQTFLMSHQPDDANTYLLKFSKLMRLVLENSQHSEVPLKEDMQALELYMQLENIRLVHPFTYQFHIDSNIDAENDTIPPLILQPFVENAIWHGLQYKPEPGNINIYISKKDNALHAIVEDNGAGRDMSKKSHQPMLIKKESLGMKLTEERLKILNELKKIKAQFKITDLFTSENKPAGTRVELSLPSA